MAGPTTEVRSSDKEIDDDNDSTSSEEGPSLEDEPWDQRRPSAKDSNSINKAAAMRPLYSQEATGEQDEDDDEDEPLDDGELPSLSGNIVRNNTLANSVQDVGALRTTTQPLKPGSDHVLKAISPKPGRKFWGQREDSERFYDAKELIDEERDNGRPSRESGTGRKYVDEDGPDDEMAARRAGSRSRTSAQPPPVRSVKKYDDAQTDNESQLSEEEEEEEHYEASFCGQTLNAIGDMCGGNLNLTGSATDKIKDRKQNKRSLTTSPPVEKNLRHSTFPSSAGMRRSESARKSPRLSRSPPPVDESQQEHTAIEVEFVEPIKTVTSSDSQAGASDAQKKNAYLNAIAKKAKDNFQNKKLRAPKSAQPNNAETEDKVSQSAREIETPFTDVVAEAGLEHDYNNFNAAEKRKFIKLINSGVIAADATKQVLDDRKVTQEKELGRPEAALPKPENIDDKERATQKATKVAARLSFWKRSHQTSPSQPRGADADAAEDIAVGDQGARSNSDGSANVSPAGGEVEPVFQLAETGADNECSADTAGASISDADSIPFQRSGSHYYDAVRKDFDDDVVVVESVTRGREEVRGNEIAKAQRFFNAGKPKGFAALSDSPEKRSKSAPRLKLAPDDPSRSPFVALRHDDEMSDSRRIFAGDEVESKSAGTLAVSKVSKANPVGTTSSAKFINCVEKAADTRKLSSVESIDSSPRADTKTRSDFGPEVIRRGASMDDEDDLSHPRHYGGTASLLNNTESRAVDRSTPPRIPEKDWDEVNDEPRPPTSPASDTQKLLGQASTRSPPDQVRAISGVDVSMDTYLSSTADVYSGSVVAAHQHDNMSVYTAGTNITGATSYTQSSRVRRPGAAKTRLAKQKQIEQVTAKKVQGWHETIRAAAESTNRTWDPKKGWVDYEEPDAYPADSLPSERGKIRIDLDRSVLSHREMDSSQEHSTSSVPPVCVPFPQQWEQERDAMLSAPSTDVEAMPQLEKIARGDVDEEEKIELPQSGETEPARAAHISDDTTAEESTPTGWLESMRAASASLAKTGKVWDPQNGWTSVPRYGLDAPDIVDFDIPISPDEEAVAIDLASARAMDSPQVEALLPEQCLQDSAEEPRLLVSLPPQVAGKKLNRWMAKKTEKELPSHSQSVLSTESSDRAVASGGVSSRLESDQQLGADALAPTVAARGPPVLSQHEPAAAESSENDSGALTNQSSMFASVDSRYNVDVVKVKVDRDDLNLFPRGGQKKIPHGVWHQVSPPTTSLTEARNSIPDEQNVSDEDPATLIAFSETPRSNVSVVSRDTASRRGGGPIDLDEVDETWDSDDDGRPNVDWLPDGHSLNRSGDLRDQQLARSSLQGAHDGEDEYRHIKNWKDCAARPYDARSILTQSVEAGRTATSEVSPSKRIPMLQRSKRDTSPLSVRKLPGGASLGATDELEHNRSLTGSSIQRDASPFHMQVIAHDQSVSPRNGRKTEALSRGASPVRARNALDESRPHGRRLPVAAFHPNGRDSDTIDLRVRDSGVTRPGQATRSGGAFADKILHEVQSPESPSVKTRLQVWETRIETSHSNDAGEFVEQSRGKSKDGQTQYGIAGWRSFLGKKVHAESAAASAGERRPLPEVQMTKEPKGDVGPLNRQALGDSDLVPSNGHQTDDDSLFQFVDKRGLSRNDSSALDLSDLSPIQANEELSDNDNALSDAYGPTDEQRRSSSFLQRLTECAAPMMPHKLGQGESSASPIGNLSFFRPSSAGSTGFVPTALCGRQDVVDEPDGEAEISHLGSAEKHVRSMSFGDEKPRSLPASRDKAETIRVSSSSVVSEDFGAKTAYLDSVAMKAAVSKPRRSSSRGKRHELLAGSSVASGATEHSEKWKAFLERKKASDASPAKSRASSADVSHAAEKYAAEKVEEIMTKMALRTKTVSRSRDVHKETNEIVETGEEFGSESMSSRRKAASLTAAEDLAAARVEAMMAALSTSHIDEGEI